MNYSYYNQETFTFTERGITFSIFENGEFDFYMSSRANVQAGVNVGGVSISYNSGYDYDAYVQYDDYGAILQIEDVPIYYDSYGRINRAGDVRIHYNGRRLSRIGGLYLHYNNYGNYSHFTGYVNYYNRNYVYHPYHNYFVRPYFNRCIVSYNPYRRYYNPIRYNYYRGNNGRGYYKGYKRGYKTANRSDGRRFKSIDSRIRTTDSNDRRAYDRRSKVERSSRVANNNSGARRTSQQRSVAQNRTAQRRTNDNIGTRRNANTVQRNANTTRKQSSATQQRRSSGNATQKEMQLAKIMGKDVEQLIVK